MLGIKVAVTGITGYIGSQIAADLVAKGYTVHGALRRYTPKRIEHLNHLNDGPGTIQYFETDLQEPGSFDKALVGCKYAIHCASPNKQEADDPQKEIVDPAVEGILNFLRSCHKADVKRVVVTSSIAAMMGCGGKFDESCWNSDSDLHTLPYFYSKTLAEKEAWKYVNEVATKMKLVTIAASAVIGPSLLKSNYVSGPLITDLFEEKTKAAVNFLSPIVDVRDVSIAHIQAMENENASGRYIISHPDSPISMKYIMKLLEGEGYDMPKRDLTSPMFTNIIKLVSYVYPGGHIGLVIRKFLGNPLVPDSSKSLKDLNFTYRDIKTTMEETFQDMREKGLIPQVKTEGVST